jgi:hypothetical protein
MGFFNKPWKATKGAINNYVPGGRYLTGAASDHQKFHYKAALERHDNYAREAQNQINALSQNLEQGMHNLRSLEEQKYYSSLKGKEIQGYAHQYTNLLDNFERQKAGVALEAEALKAAFEDFKNKAPALAGKISEVEKLPGIFQNLYETVASQKERLAGLTEEEAATQIKKHKADTEGLKQQRMETENKIRSSMEEITHHHRGLEHEKANLEQRLSSYKYRQDQLLAESSNFDGRRSHLEKIIREYKDEQDRINGEYSRQQANTEQLKNNLTGYISSAQGQLDSLAKDVEGRAAKYKRESKTTGIVQGAALALGSLALAGGIGGLANNITTGAALSGTATSTPMSSILLGKVAAGLGYAAPLLGVGTYLQNVGKGQKLAAGFERVNLDSAAGGGGVDLSHIARYGLGSPKVSIPELGGLAQSLSHFAMPTVPKLQDLPKLHEALGKITSLKDIEDLKLGLPTMTSASGKKYSTEVLYDPDFIKKLRKVSRTIGAPYLKNQSNNQGAAYV